MCRRYVRELAVPQVEGGDHSLAVEHALGLRRAIGRDRIEVKVAAVLDREHDPVAVPNGFPRVRIRTALPVQRGRQELLIGAVGIHHADLAVVRIRAVLGHPAVGDAAAIR